MKEGLSALTASCHIGLCLGAAGLWEYHAIGDDMSTEVKVSAVLGVIVVVWIVGAWLRNRRRRQLKDLQDSALW
ncbi:MAG: hypothetical protein IPN53_22500 [Comamonadaceae bacterium]|nr:hypothetical protein [Comamonadaceae bacterium]